MATAENPTKEDSPREDWLDGLFRRFGTKLIGDILWWIQFAIITCILPGLVMIIGLWAYLSFTTIAWCGLVTFLFMLFVAYKVAWGSVKAGMVATSMFTEGGGHYHTKAGKGFLGVRQIWGFTWIQRDDIGVVTRIITIPVTTASKEFAAAHIQPGDEAKFDANEFHTDSPATVDLAITGKVDENNHYIYYSVVGKEPSDLIRRLEELGQTIVPGIIAQTLSLAMLLQEKYMLPVAKIVLDRYRDIIEKDSEDGKVSKWGYLIQKLEMVGKAPKELLDALERVTKAQITTQENTELAKAEHEKAKGERLATQEKAEGKKFERIKISEAELTERENRVKGDMVEVVEKAKAVKDNPEVAMFIEKEYQMEFMKNFKGGIFLSNDPLKPLDQTIISGLMPKPEEKTTDKPKKEEPKNENTSDSDTPN